MHIYKYGQSVTVLFLKDHVSFQATKEKSTFLIPNSKYEITSFHLIAPNDLN